MKWFDIVSSEAWSASYNIGLHQLCWQNDLYSSDLTYDIIIDGRCSKDQIY